MIMVPQISIGSTIIFSITQGLDARLSVKKTADAQNRESDGMTMGVTVFAFVGTYGDTSLRMLYLFPSDGEPVEPPSTTFISSSVNPYSLYTNSSISLSVALI
jgi:hypothetical protein